MVPISMEDPLDLRQMGLLEALVPEEDHLLPLLNVKRCLMKIVL